MNQSTAVLVSSDRKLVRVTCEGLPDDFSVEAYANHFQWNGFATPMFTMEAGLALCKVVPEKLSYDNSRRAFRYIDVDADYPEVEWIEPEKYAIGGDVVELFLIGDGWCWYLADDLEAGAQSDESLLQLRLRPASYFWLSDLAKAEGLPLAEHAAFLVASYIEQRMECRGRLDLTGLEIPLTLAKNSVRLSDGVSLSMKPTEWIRLVDAVLVIDQDDTSFHQLSLHERREAFAEAVLEQLARELGRA